MSKVIIWLQDFFRGRNNIDKFALVLFIAYLVICVLNMVLHFLPLSILGLVIFAYAVFRTLSKNIPQRQLENEKFLYVWAKIISFCKLTQNRFKYAKTHRYRTCPNCKAHLRLPKRKGKHTVGCPKCKKDFKVKILF